jgi:very-short-patch-repair endonuclease
MSKSKSSAFCPVCEKQFSASVFARHVRSLSESERQTEISRQKHKELIEHVEGNIEEIIKKFYGVCNICDKQIELSDLREQEQKKIKNLGLLIYCNWTGERTLKRCAEHREVIWNLGLTKETNDSLKKISKGRTGENNPIFKTINDPEAREKWLKNIKIGKNKSLESGYLKWKKGKSYDEIFGKEKAIEIKKKMSIALLAREVSPHTGHKHSEETKDRLREITAKRIANNKDKISKPQRLLFESLVQRNLDPKLEYVFGFYAIDIAFPELQTAIEVDGDYWHCNEELGFFCKDKPQVRNLANDKRKSKFLLKNNWSLVRIWESEINGGIEECLKRIEDHLEQKKILLQK